MNSKQQIKDTLKLILITLLCFLVPISILLLLFCGHIILGTVIIFVICISLFVYIILFDDGFDGYETGAH